MSDRLHLLVVDDDVQIRDLLQRYFTSHGFAVATAGNGAEMRAAVAAAPIAAILLDLGLPGEDGLELMRELRRTWHGALIIVTGRGEAVDRVVGLELGADDYVTKPFDLRELLARVRSVLRRSDPVPAAAAPPAPATRLKFAGFSLDAATRTLTAADNRAVALTTGEFDLLLCFVAHPNQILSRDQLMDALHGHAAGPYDRAIDVQVGRLRRKIEPQPRTPRLIKSVRHAGYLFTPVVQRGKP